MAEAPHSVAYCPHCRARVSGAWRCLCGSWLPSTWLLAAGFTLGVVSVALAGLVSAVAYAQVRDVYRGLGAAPPLVSGLYFALAAPLVWLGAVLVVLGPVAAAVVGRREAGAGARLVRRYVALTLLLAAWSLLGLALWYYVVRAVIGVLS